MKQPSTDKTTAASAISTIVNLSRTLGTLSYSRLQCGQADVLAEFTKRIQVMAEANRDQMRGAFQKGFDKSQQDSSLLSEDECERLTLSRKRQEVIQETNIKKNPLQSKKPNSNTPKLAEDPKLKHLRIAQLSGQLAYKTRFCKSKKVFNRDYNNFIKTVPGEYRDDVKTAYWKGFKHGKHMNKNLTKDQC